MYNKEVQLSPRDREMRCVSWNLANCQATVQKLLVRQVLNNNVRLTTFDKGQPGQAGTRRNIHPLTPIRIIVLPLSPFSICNGPRHPLFQITCLTVLTYNLFPGLLWSSPWSWTLNFILHTFLHQVIVIFSQQMTVPAQPVLLQYQCYVIYP